MPVSKFAIRNLTQSACSRRVYEVFADCNSSVGWTTQELGKDGIRVNASAAGMLWSLLPWLRFPESFAFSATCHLTSARTFRAYTNLMYLLEWGSLPHFPAECNPASHSRLLLLRWGFPVIHVVESMTSDLLVERWPMILLTLFFHVILYFLVFLLVFLCVAVFISFVLIRATSRRGG
jgi:hypothetical protein